MQQTAGSFNEAELLQQKVESLQVELEVRGAKLVEVERDLQTEKYEKDTINQELKGVKEKLRESNLKLQEGSELLLMERVKVSSLEHNARQMMQDRFDSEEELKGRIQKLGEEVERWKKEVGMHVEAQVKLIGASSPDQQEAAQGRAGAHPQPAPNAGMKRLPSLLTLSLPRVSNSKFPLQSQEILHHTVWRTWLFLAYSDETWLYHQCNTSLIHFFLKGWENVLYELSTMSVITVNSLSGQGLSNTSDFTFHSFFHGSNCL